MSSVPFVPFKILYPMFHYRPRLVVDYLSVISRVHNRVARFCGCGFCWTLSKVTTCKDSRSTSNEEPFHMAITSWLRQLSLPSFYVFSLLCTIFTLEIWFTFTCTIKCQYLFSIPCQFGGSGHAPWDFMETKKIPFSHLWNVSFSKPCPEPKRWLTGITGQRKGAPDPK